MATTKKTTKTNANKMKTADLFEINRHRANVVRLLRRQADALEQGTTIGVVALFFDHDGHTIAHHYDGTNLYTVLGALEMSKRTVEGGITRLEALTMKRAK